MNGEKRFAVPNALEVRFTVAKYNFLFLNFFVITAMVISPK